eukprot:TRINITY_DN7652_c0_g1_i1.p1 TRINITY_DN7652_c0_g1~~TRINITY_DN7652_c0_g1_i1.p1  ORF type:complete len:450 (-),score=106.44 TRINITY_DN7652_c0_g1_i1:97-1446(-)
MPRQRARRRKQRHKPLAEQIKDDQKVGLKPSKVAGSPTTQKNMDTDKNQQTTATSTLDSDLAQKALTMVREQQEEENEEAIAAEKKGEAHMRYVEQTSYNSDEEETPFAFSDEEYDQNPEEFSKDYQIDAGDERVLQMWFNPKKEKKRTLGDIIFEKIREHEAKLSKDMDPIAAGKLFENRMDPAVVEMFKGVGKVLKKYSSGKLPKAFKLLPSLQNWEELLYLTQPEEWSPPATRAATKIFASSLNSNGAQQFYSVVLLPAMREDIENHKKLNFHLYLALKKSVFKPAAFYKGIVLPLCESGDCTLREAAIIASVIAKCSIPALHSAVAIMKLAQLEYSGANSLFLRVLLDKKYSLPFKVIDVLVEHFVRFRFIRQKLPVLWHQALLVFVQRYKNDLTQPQKTEIKKLIKVQRHLGISPEIFREFQFASDRSKEEAMVPQTKPLHFLQ